MSGVGIPVNDTDNYGRTIVKYKERYEDNNNNNSNNNNNNNSNNERKDKREGNEQRYGGFDQRYSHIQENRHNNSSSYNNNNYSSTRSPPPNHSGWRPRGPDRPGYETYSRSRDNYNNNNNNNNYHNRDRDRNYRDQGNRRSRSPPHHTSSSSFPSSTSYSTRNSPPRGSRSRLPPMKSYKNFMLTQTDDATPEIFQKRYDEYQIQYCKDASNYFFEKNKCEEWFRERYDPLVQQGIEKESQEWGNEESKRILDYFTNIHDITDNIHFGISLSDNIDKINDINESENTNEEVKSSLGYLHHFDGHKDRTIYLNGIPANCTKSILTQSIRTAFNSFNESNNTTTTTTENEIVTVGLDRVLLGQPTWNYRGASIPSFDRVGWVVLTEGSNLITALKLLRELKVIIPGPIDSATGEPVGSISFRLQANFHNIKDLSYLPEIYSQQSRIQFDYDRAHELAVLFDEEKNIPNENNLDTLLSKFPNLSLINRLDLIILYLRRVHFFVYYAGRRFHDEAHLTSFSSSISYRKPLQLSEESNESPSSNEINDENQDETELIESNNNSEEKTSEQVEDENDQENEIEEKEDEKVVVEEQENEVEGEEEEVGDNEGLYPLVNLNITYQSKSNSASENLDKRIKEFILQARQRVIQLRKVHKLPSITLDDGTIQYPPSTPDEEDCQAIAKAQEAVIEQVTTENCVIQSDGKARCGLTWCNKLFKGKDFLSKHIRNKHPDLSLMRLIRISEPYMFNRFMAEDITSRPLGPIEVESSGGLEQKTIKEVYEAASTRLSGSSSSSSSTNSFRFDRNSNFNRRRVSRDFSNRNSFGSHGNHEKDQDQNNHNNQQHQFRERNDRRFSDGGIERRHHHQDSWNNNNHNNHNNNNLGDDDRRINNKRRESVPISTSSSSSTTTTSNPNPEYIAPRPEDNNSRKLHSYLDVDSPMDVTVNIDYGVALPPPKKRKLLAKTE